MIAMNEYEKEISDAISKMGLSAVVKVELASSSWFQLLSRNFPAKGSKIDWEKTHGSAFFSREGNESEVDFYIRMFNAISKEKNLNGNIVYVGDSVTEFAIRGLIQSVAPLLPDLLLIPQHHYLLEETGLWCMAFTMEGDFGFGFSNNFSSKVSC